MGEIQSQFNATFSHWDIRLPPDALANRSRGKIVKAGWAIWYLFGSDEKGEYLDYYASHRMTYDEHVRIYASGEYESLPAIQSARITSQHPEGHATLEAEQHAENRRIAKMLEAKGFGIEGNERGGVRIKRSLTLEQLE